MIGLSNFIPGEDKIKKRRRLSYEKIEDKGGADYKLAPTGFKERLSDTERFIKLFRSGLDTLIEITSKQPTAMVLILHAAKTVKKNNPFFEIRDYKKLGISKSAFYKAVKFLIELGVFVKDGKEFGINPNILFNGDRAVYKKTVLEKYGDRYDFEDV